MLLFAPFRNVTIFIGLYRTSDNVFFALCDNVTVAWGYTVVTVCILLAPSEFLYHHWIVVQYHNSHLTMASSFHLPQLLLPLPWIIQNPRGCGHLDSFPPTLLSLMYEQIYFLCLKIVRTFRHSELFILVRNYYPNKRLRYEFVFNQKSP